MGNTDSHSGFAPAPSSSLGFPARREEVLSARSWWRSTQAGSRSRRRGHTNRHAASWTYEHASKALQGVGPPQICLGDGGYREDGGGSDGTRGERTSVESGGSPKVLLRKDGTVRVEFTNSRVISGKPQGLDGVTTVAATEPSLRTSKGSSLSSDGSWYDSPWGTGSEFADNVFINSSGSTAYFSARTEEAVAPPPGGYTGFFSAQVDVPPGLNPDFLPPAESAAGYTSCFSGWTEDSGIGDSVILPAETTDISHASPRHASPLHSRHNALPAFPTSLDAVPPLDDVIQEEQGTGGAGQLLYSSQTLPCRRANSASATSGSNRKDFLKSRIRRLSDWTGSLSRKKRRIQEPVSSDTELSGCSTLWSSNHLHTLNQIQNQLPVPAGLCGSSRSLNPSDLQRQNVYDSFMQELETGRSSSAAERTEQSDGDEEGEEVLEEDMDGEEEVVGGGEQLDVLLEKEQGVVRRAGWLSFKALLAVSRDRKLEPLARRRWRHFWVMLKGCTLLFYETCRKKASGEHELSPRYALLADDSIVQAVPEHPRREHVFCLSNVHGDVYLFQATNQTDLENWVTAIHSASAALLARRQGTEDTLRLLRCRSRSLLHKIDTDGKMKKMAELQLSVIKEPKSRRAVQSQIQQWEQNLEKLNLDLFRLRCYQSSLQGGELPNPKGLLAVASRPSKSMLGRLGVFSVSSFHALVCSRDEAALRSRTQSGGRLGRRGLPCSLRTLDRVSSRASAHSTSQELRCVASHREVAPPAGHPVAVQATGELQTSRFHVFTLYVCRLDDEKDFGFTVTGHVDGGGRSHVYVGDIDPVGLLARQGLRAGDEVLAVNGTPISGLDLDLMQSLFNQEKLQLLMRRDESPGPEEAAVTISWPQAGDPRRHPASPAPPAPPDVQAWISSAVSRHSEGSPLEGSDDVMVKCLEDVETQNMDQVFPLYHTFPEGRATEADFPRNPYFKEAGLPPASPAHLSVCQRLRKVIQELVDTEKSYVKDLVRLLDVYLTPLQKETFLSKDEMEALFGSLPEMLDFQRVFLQTLEDRISSCPDFSSLETPGQFKTLLFSLGGSFLYYADHFKHYSGFCVNHIKVQKVLERAKTDGTFKHFLEARNPTNQHSSSLESYLIKPIQRVLKYPLLLRELVSLTDPGSPEHAHLTEALRAMEKVASHINEMQKIYEDYGAVFDQLAAEQSGTNRQVTEISMDEFLVQSSVGWLNPLPCLGRLRREPELTLFVFKRAVVLVYRDSSRLKKRPSGSRSADPDPFRFRWLIPVSALQVRPTGVTASEDPCVWELVHCRSEAEGRPETVFTLCSSCLGSKASVLRALRSLLRDRAPSGSSTERSTSWRRRRQQQRCRSSSQRTSHLQSDSGSTLGETSSEPLLPSHAPSASACQRTRLCSLTGELEAQLQRLNFTEEEAQREAEEEGEEEKGQGCSAQRSPADVLDVLDRDFSVHSMASIINEDCFYASAIPTLQG